MLAPSGPSPSLNFQRGPWTHAVQCLGFLCFLFVLVVLELEVWAEGFQALKEPIKDRCKGFMGS